MLNGYRYRSGLNIRGTVDVMVCEAKSTYSLDGKTDLGHYDRCYKTPAKRKFRGKTFTLATIFPPSEFSPEIFVWLALTAVVMPQIGLLSREHVLSDQRATK